MLINHRYQIQKLLGRGGFGQTYLAYDTQCFNHPCVLKEFAPASRAEYAMQKARELFEREARVLYEIDHPQIPKFLAWFVAENRLFLVQEYIAGKTYAQLLRQRQQSQQQKTYTEAEVTQWLRDLLPVLDYLHQRQIVHRDISPDNVMLPSSTSNLAFGHSSNRLNNRPVLIDFGLVKQTINQIYTHSTASFVGKFGYAPPEQIRMGQCFPSSDLYALAVTALVLLTGREPQLLIDHATLEWHWRDDINISPALTEILERMLQDKPKHRYQSAAEILALLQPAATSSRSSSPPSLHSSTSNAHDDATPCQNAAGYTSPPHPTPFLLQQAQQELTRCIGPIASFVLENLLTQQPQLSPTQLIEALALEIPDPAQAEAFSTRLLAIAANSSQPHAAEVMIRHATPSRQPSLALSPDFLERCRQALVRCIGPVATLILDDLLEQNPQLTSEELIEAIVNEIADSQQAQKFQQLVSS